MQFINKLKFKNIYHEKINKYYNIINRFLFIINI